MRYSEKLLQGDGISVNTLDLSEVIGRADRLKDDDPRVRERIEEIQGYVPTGETPHPSLARMARMAIVIDDWMAANDLVATALQCWTSVQLNYGVNVCTLMSMMSDRLLPSACEVDVTGVASMYALQLASRTPSALVDWNNSYAGDPDKCVLFHCGNWAKSFLPDAQMEYAHVLSNTLGVENTRGAISGRVPAGPLTYARISTDDQAGAITAYVGEGQFTDDPLNTFGAPRRRGSTGVAKAHALHLSQRIRTPHGHQRLALRPNPGRSIRELPRLGRISSQRPGGIDAGPVRSAQRLAHYERGLAHAARASRAI